MSRVAKRRLVAVSERIPDLPMARIDGRNLRFGVVVDGRVVTCAISQYLLRDMTAAGRHTKPQDMLACFLGIRPQIEALALRRITARRVLPQGVLYIWPEDEDAEPDAPLCSDRAGVGL